MLSAKEARKIAGSELLQIMNLIRESAYRGGLSITLEYNIDKNTIKTLTEYGYSVCEDEIPVYYESPYGKVDEYPNYYKKETIISWNENTNYS